MLFHTKIQPLIKVLRNCICSSWVKSWPLVQKIEETRLFQSNMTLCPLKLGQGREISFWLHKIFICAGLVKIYSIVRKLERRQKIHQQDSRPKQYIPTYLERGWGHNENNMSLQLFNGGRGGATSFAHLPK